MSLLDSRVRPGAVTRARQAVVWQTDACVSALPLRLSLPLERRRSLVAVASGRAPADLVVTGGQVLNVFTGKLERVAVGIAEGRVAWLREEPGPARETLDAEGAVIVPGMIDAHCHVDILTTPGAFADEVLRHGTTAGASDTLGLVVNLDDEDLYATVDALGRHAFKFLWGLRASRDSFTAEDPARLPSGRLDGLIAGLPDVVAAGELTAWPALLAGDERLERFVDAMIASWRRVDGHAPGASARTLTRLAAAGVTSDHEAISGPEVVDRVTLGFWTMLRHSSLRRDARQLAEAVVEAGLPRHRLLLTTDGPVPQDLLDGHMDLVVREVVAGGIPPVDAVRMATLNPATYLGLDAHLGAIAPGRCADLVLVDDLERFRPRMTLCDGRPLPEAGEAGAEIPQRARRLPMGVAELSARDIEDACDASGVTILMDGVVPVRDDSDGEPGILAALVSRDGRSIAGARLRGVDVRAVATTHTGARDVFLIGHDAAALAEAYATVAEMGGGMACPGATLPLPIFGYLGAGTVREVARDLVHFEEVAGVPETGPPFPFVSLFLTLPALPGICITTTGVIDVRAKEVVAAPRPLRTRRDAVMTR